MELGDFHPIFLHFPIVLFVAAFVLDILHALYGKNVREVASWMTIVGAVLVAPTIFTGLSAADRFYGDNPDLFYHRYLAYSIGIFGLIHAVIRAGSLMGRWFPKPGFTLALSSLIVLLIGLAADEGGLISRGRTPFRTKKSTAAVIASVAGAPVDSLVTPDDLMGELTERVGVEDVAGIFEANNCSMCHANAFPEGRPTGLSTGSNPMLPRNEDGTLKDPATSPFYQTVIVHNEMPIPQEDHPGGLSDSERLLLLAWIKNGAPCHSTER